MSYMQQTLAANAFGRLLRACPTAGTTPLCHPYCVVRHNLSGPTLRFVSLFPSFFLASSAPPHTTPCFLLLPSHRPVEALPLDQQLEVVQMCLQGVVRDDWARLDSGRGSEGVAQMADASQKVGRWAQYTHTAGDLGQVEIHFVCCLLLSPELPAPWGAFLSRGPVWLSNDNLCTLCVCVCRCRRRCPSPHSAALSGPAHQPAHASCCCRTRPTAILT